MTGTLTELQEGIVREIAKTPGINMRQIALNLDKHTPAVHNSLHLLIENKLVVVEEPKGGVAKGLNLTGKGFTYAVVHAKIDYEGWIEKYGSKLDRDELQTLKLLVVTKEARKRLYHTIFDFILKNGLVDEKTGQLTVTKSEYYRRLMELEIFKETMEIRRQEPKAINEKKIREMQKNLEKTFNLRELQMEII
jgi:hypothetical protein